MTLFHSLLSLSSLHTFSALKKKGAQKPSAVANVVVEIVLGDIEHILEQHFRLLLVRHVQLGAQIENLRNRPVFVATGLMVCSR